MPNFRRSCKLEIEVRSLRPDLLQSNERVDELYANNIKIIQSNEVFSFSLDAVLLAYFAQPILKPNGKIVDLCAGNGAIGLFLSAKSKAQIIEVEIQERLADMAKRSIKLNNLDKQIDVLNIDLNNVKNYIASDSVDTVTCNPPYFKNLITSKKNPNEYLAIARHEITVTLEQVIKETSSLLKMGGKFYMVHRPERFVEIIDLLRANRLAPKKIQMVYPKAGKEANMLLIEAIKDGKSGGVRFLEPIVVYKDNGEYTTKMQGILYGE